MRGRRTRLTTWLAVLAATAGAAPTTSDAPDDATPFTMELADRSVVSGRLSIQTLAVDTLFGQLQVPVSHVRGFTPGLDSRPRVAQRLETLLRQLGSDEVEQRDEAQRQLLGLGPTLRPYLETHRDDADPERRLRVEQLLESLDEMLENEEPAEAEAAEPITRSDRVDTTEFTILGRISPRTFEIQTAYGPLTLALEDIERARHGGAPQAQEARRTIVVDGAALAPASYKSTGLRLRRGQQVTIRATGRLTLAPWGPDAISGPDGVAAYGWFDDNQIPNGALVARIGQGPPFLVGSSQRFVAPRSGMLELAVGISPAQDGGNFHGQYEVRVRVASGP